MKEIKKILLSIGVISSTIFGLFVNCSPVKAETYTGQAIWPSEFVPNVYIKKIKADGSGKYQQAKFIRRSEDNAFVYCLQPFVDIDNNLPYYNIARSDYELYLNMSKEQFRKVNLYAYYGYGYGNHNDAKWYAITQVLIWRTADPSSQFFFTDTLNGNRNDSLFANEIAELENLVNTHYVKPEFDNVSNIKLPITNTISINDKNNKLSEYKIESQNNVSASISGNTLNITATEIGNASIKLKKTDTKFSVPPVVYFSDHSQNVFRLGAYDPLEVDLNLEVIGGKVAIQKVDSETLKNYAQGQATLKGAVYGVFKEDGTKLAEITTDENGYAKSDYLPCIGKLYIQEIKESLGYELDSTKYYFELTKDNLEPTIQVKEKVIKNYISILKQYDNVDGTTQFLNAEENIKFEIYYPNGTKYGEITTDKNGYATLDIPYGVWKFHQVNSNTGFEKIYDFYITVNENSELEQYYNILNNKLSAYLQVFKVDSETGKTIELANTTFKILNVDTNKYVSQYVGGKVYSEFKTDETGKFITYLKLEAGNYKLIEVSSPNSYLINTDGLPFTIGNDTHYNYTTYGAFITVYFKDTPIKGQVEINKMGEEFVPDNGSFSYEKVTLENVVFNIYADEDIKTADGKHLYYSKGTLVDVITTDKNGYAISKKLPLGKYKLVEAKTDSTHVLDSEEYHFELTEIDNKTAVVYKSFNILNKYQKGELEFTKTDLISGEAIANTKIEIYTDSDELIFSGLTDKDGKIVIKNLPVNQKFYILESEPATGFVKTDEKVYFEIKENGEIVKASMTNKPITGKLEFTKIDISTSEPLPNTLIEIYNVKTNELVFSGRTDENGKIVIDGLRFSDYVLYEKEAPESYLLNEEPMYFSIKEDGEIIKCTMTNEKIIVEVPNTEKNDNFLVEIISGIICISGIGIIIYARKKSEEE